VRNKIAALINLAVNHDDETQDRAAVLVIVLILVALDIYFGSAPGFPF
jgi:hypothetical protein